MATFCHLSSSVLPSCIYCNTFHLLLALNHHNLTTFYVLLIASSITNNLPTEMSAPSEVLQSLTNLKLTFSDLQEIVDRTHSDNIKVIIAVIKKANYEAGRDEQFAAMSYCRVLGPLSRLPGPIASMPSEDIMAIKGISKAIYTFIRSV